MYEASKLKLQFLADPRSFPATNQFSSAYFESVCTVNGAKFFFFFFKLIPLLKAQKLFLSTYYYVLLPLH